jgi:hypothetical protein
MRTRPDGLPERHIDIEDEGPEPTLAELCRPCREIAPGACGEPCGECDDPVARHGGTWLHTHGARAHRARPRPVTTHG